MKLSELSTDQALDVMCELTPYIDNIVNDPDTVNTIGKVVVHKDGKINRYGVFALAMGRITEFAPLLLKNHRQDLYSILSVMNDRPVDEIAGQKFVETMWQIRELFQDEEFFSFLKSFAPQEQTAQSAPSARSPA